MLTKYEQELMNYWKNWKSGMGPYKPKHTRKMKGKKKTFREIMEFIQFELGLDEYELDDLLIPEEEWDDFEE